MLGLQCTVYIYISKANSAKNISAKLNQALARLPSKNVFFRETKEALGTNELTYASGMTNYVHTLMI